MVGRDMPVNCARGLMPPRPSSSTFCATYTRAWYSFNVPSTRSQWRPGSEIARLVAMRA